jgi:hypothetical protein
MMSRGEGDMDDDAEAAEARKTREAALAEGYRQMAADVEHELEADEWAEALIGDALEVEGEIISA